jgi:hypothetical protein
MRGLDSEHWVVSDCRPRGITTQNLVGAVVQLPREMSMAGLAATVAAKLAEEVQLVEIDWGSRGSPVEGKP